MSALAAHEETAMQVAQRNEALEDHILVAY
jgi:hypothetical protein